MTAMTSRTPVIPAESATRLKNVFEQSLAVLSEQGDIPSNAATDSRKGKIRVRPRSLPLHTDAVSLRKRALDNAAKALATLWKIPGPARVKTRSAA
jgi:hypothetical protein